MTNKQYKRIDKVLQKALSQGSIEKEDLQAVRAALRQDKCIGCQYNDGYNHLQCSDSYCVKKNDDALPSEEKISQIIANEEHPNLYGYYLREDLDLLNNVVNDLNEHRYPLCCTIERELIDEN